MTDTVIELHRLPSYLTPEERAAVIEAHSMPQDRPGPAEPGDEARYYARRAREAIADGDLGELLAVLDAMDLFADRLDARA